MRNERRASANSGRMGNQYSVKTSRMARCPTAKPSPVSEGRSRFSRNQGLQADPCAALCAGAIYGIGEWSMLNFRNQGFQMLLDIVVSSSSSRTVEQAREIIASCAVCKNLSKYRGESCVL